jgi:hypothetical protein
VGKREGKFRLGKLSLDGRMLFIWIFRKFNVEALTAFQMSQVRDRWRALVNMEINIHVL